MNISYGTKLDSNITWQKIKNATGEEREKYYKIAPTAQLYVLLSDQGGTLEKAEAQAELDRRKQLVTLKNIFVSAAVSFITSVITVILFNK